MRGDARRFGWRSVLVIGILSFPLAATLADGPAPAKTEKSDAKSPTSGLGQRSDREVGPGEQLSFRQSEVTAEMSELEQRMFRLSESLKLLEPENSSRLMLGLKYAREELILNQMRETQAALAKLSLKNAADEQKQLLAKLERLQQLLLSTDLDFEMKLERLRQIREVLRKLDTVIKEEAREEKQSKEAAQREKELADLANRRAALEKLVKEQTEHVERNTPLAKQNTLNDQDREAVSKLSAAQETTRQATASLAAELQNGESPKNLAAAAESMQSAVDSLGKSQPREALPPMQQALDSLKKELEQVTKEEAAKKAQLTPEKFAEMRKDQEANRRTNEDVSEMTRALGSNGAAALAELLRAGGNMGGAESAFGKLQAGQGNGEQGRSLAALKYAQELLAEEAERLARQLRQEVKKRVIDGLTAMLEEQIVVRGRTVTLAKGVKDGSRQALNAVTGLAKREEKITDLAQELINVVEETEFGIALPAALAAVRDATEAVQTSLAEGDASDEIVAAEKQIEADLKTMLDIVNEMSDANSKSGKRRRGGMEDERKEQNRIISELKMIRLLQTRTQQNTTDVDAKRASAALSPAIRKRIEELEGRQEDIRDATERLATERADDLPQQP
ncbi:MAG: hypothetical protein HY288_16045 [Planctomycetia bacterium]|nr:hypothetical protein [Planctomycetia bacterium]